MFDPMMGAEMARAEELGLLDTSASLINRVANELTAICPPGPIQWAEFADACYACGVDPHSFTDADLAQLEKRMNELI